MPARLIKCVALCASFVGVSAFAAPPLIHQDFEASESGWTAFGPETAHVHVTHDATTVKNGKGALELDYVASASTPAAAALPVKQSLQSMQSLGLWLRAESATAAAITLSEKQGGRYISVFWLQPQIWQRVELSPDDFYLAQNANDPKDPDGKLDLDQIEAISIIDLSQILNSSIGQKNDHIAAVTHTGPQKLYLDDFEVSADRPAWYHARTTYHIDSFDHPQLNWFTFGGPDLTLDTSRTVIPGNAMKASYHQMESTFVLMAHTLPRQDFSGATHLAFDIASESDAHIMFVLENQTPPNARYHVDVEVKGGGKADHREVALSAFVPDEAAQADGKLNLSELKTIMFLDITGAYTEQEAPNTVWIGNINMAKVTSAAKQLK